MSKFCLILLLSRDIEAIKVHDLIPGRYKVMDKLRLPVRTGIDFRQSPDLGVRAEDKVDSGAELVYHKKAFGQIPDTGDPAVIATFFVGPFSCYRLFILSPLNPCPS